MRKISELQETYPDPDHSMIVEDRSGAHYKVRLGQIMPPKEEIELRESNPTVKYYWEKYQMALKLAMDNTDEQ